ncbi:hypothetical protein ACQ4PT_029819 [Festuca glaucescens]
MDMESSAAQEVSVDWRGRPCAPGRHGGMRAAVFVLGIQAFEIMAIAAVGNNLITYVFGEMHFPLSEAANVVTNFVGTIFLLSLIGGFLSDSYLGCFWTMLTFGFVELSGFILLSVQAHLPQLKPPPCNMASMDGSCEQAKGFKSSIFFVALYLVALGSGCLKPNMIAHGADQFSGGADNAKRLSTYFNSAYFSFCLGELFALTALSGCRRTTGWTSVSASLPPPWPPWLVGLVSGAAFYRNKPPQGSIFTPIARVFVAAFSKRKQICPSNPADAGVYEPARLAGNFRHGNKFRFLDKACIRDAAQQGG